MRSPNNWRSVGQPLIGLACTLAMLIVTTIGLLSGCSQHSDDPTTYPVTGRVTLDGSPVAKATVVFLPKTGGGAIIVQAMTDAEGEFDVHTFLDMGKRILHGMMPADYRIKIIKLESLSGQAPALVRRPRYALPKKYASERTSGLETTVSAEGKNELLLELRTP